MHPYLLPVLEFTPTILERMLDQTPASAIDRKTDPNRFTLREAIAHLADWEPIFLERVRAGVDNPGAKVFGIDESQRAIDQGYESWDPRESLRKFKAARKTTAEYLRSLSADDWESTVTHNEKGLMTAYDQANMLLGHDIYHLEHASQFSEAGAAAR